MNERVSELASHSLILILIHIHIHTTATDQTQIDWLTGWGETFWLWFEFDQPQQQHRD